MHLTYFSFGITFHTMKNLQLLINLCMNYSWPYILPYIYKCTIPQGHPSAPALTPPHASNLDWRSISHMIIYMYSMLFSQIIPPSPSPTESKVCSLYLCLFFCLAMSFPHSVSYKLCEKSSHQYVSYSAFHFWLLEQCLAHVFLFSELMKIIKTTRKIWD